MCVCVLCRFSSCDSSRSLLLSGTATLHELRLDRKHNRTWNNARFRWPRPSIRLRWELSWLVGRTNRTAILRKGAMHYRSVWQLQRPQNQSHGNIDQSKIPVLEQLSNLHFFPFRLVKWHKYTRRKHSG